MDISVVLKARQYKPGYGRRTAFRQESAVAPLRCLWIGPRDVCAALLRPGAEARSVLAAPAPRLYARLMRRISALVALVTAGFSLSFGCKEKPAPTPVPPSEAAANAGSTGSVASPAPPPASAA